LPPIAAVPEVAAVSGLLAGNVVRLPKRADTGADSRFRQAVEQGLAQAGEAEAEQAQARMEAATAGRKAEDEQRKKLSQLLAGVEASG